jgi:hypothetical protein
LYGVMAARYPRDVSPVVGAYIIQNGTDETNARRRDLIFRQLAQHQTQ